MCYWRMFLLTGKKVKRIHEVWEEKDIKVRRHTLEPKISLRPWNRQTTTPCKEKLIQFTVLCSDFILDVTYDTKLYFIPLLLRLSPSRRPNISRDKTWTLLLMTHTEQYTCNHSLIHSKRMTSLLPSCLIFFSFHSLPKRPFFNQFPLIVFSLFRRLIITIIFIINLWSKVCKRQREWSKQVSQSKRRKEWWLKQWKERRELCLFSCFHFMNGERFFVILSLSWFHPLRLTLVCYWICLSTFVLTSLHALTQDNVRPMHQKHPACVTISFSCPIATVHDIHRSCKLLMHQK